MANGTLATDIKTFADLHTKESVNYVNITKYHDGTDMTDAKCDGVMYRKLGTEYFCRSEVISKKPITPQMFGAKGDGIADDTDALNDFFDFIMNKAPNNSTAQISGIYRTTGKLLCVASYMGKVPCTSINAAATIKADYSANDEILLIKNWWRGKITGHLQIIGRGNTDWYSRTNGVGVSVLDCSRFSFDKLSVHYAKFDACVLLGLSYGVSITELITNYCGMATAGSPDNYTDGGTQVTRTMISYTNDGAGPVPYQSAIVELDSIPEGVDGSLSGRFFLKIGARLHSVKNVDVVGKKLTVYPHVDTSLNTGTPVKIIGGAGLYTTGGDTSCHQIGTHDALVCGIGVNNRSLYPASFGNSTFQYCGVGHIVGSAQDNVTVGGVTVESYYENNDFDIVILGGAGNASYRFVNSVALNLNKCITLFPGWGAGFYSPVGYNGFASCSIGRLIYQGNNYGNFEYEYGKDISLGQNIVYNRDSGHLYINADDDLHRLFGYSIITVLIFGSGPNKQPTGDMIITARQGKQINGSTGDIILTGLPGPVRLTFFYNAAGWQMITENIQ